LGATGDLVLQWDWNDKCRRLLHEREQLSRSKGCDNEYTWSAAPQGTNFDGLVATLFLSQLNRTAFAGHTDWRLPTSAGLGIPTTGNDPELESIADPAAAAGRDERRDGRRERCQRPHRCSVPVASARSMSW